MAYILQYLKTIKISVLNHIQPPINLTPNESNFCFTVAIFHEGFQMKQIFKHRTLAQSEQEDRIKREIDRTNAQLRHFRGVAATVLSDALAIWQQIWEACQDPRTGDQILDGLEESAEAIPLCGWPEFREKLHLLGHYLDYSQRLCQGSLESAPQDEGED